MLAFVKRILANVRTVQVALVFLTMSCGQEEIPAPPESYAAPAKTTDADALSKSKVSVSLPTPKPEEEVLTTPTPNNGQNKQGAPKDDDADQDQESGDEAAFASVCRDMATATGDLVNTKLSAPKISVAAGGKSAFGIQNKANFGGSLDLRASLLGAHLASTLSYEAVPRLAQSQVDATFKGMATKATYQFLNVTERVALANANGAWSKVFCTAQPVARSSVSSELGTIVTKFSEPLPLVLLAKTSIDRFAAELGVGREFLGVRAQVEESSVSGLSAGTSLLGDVRVMKVDPVLTVLNEKGEKRTISADLAYEVRVNFGGPDQTIKLGLKPVTRFYMSLRTQSVMAVVISHAKDGTPDAAFVSP